MPTSTVVLGDSGSPRPAAAAPAASDAWQLGPELVASFLSLSDVVRARSVCCGWDSSAEAAKVVAAQLYETGLPSDARWEAWIAIAGARRRQRADVAARSESWRRSDSDGSEAAQSGIGLDGKYGLSSEGVEGQILRDVRRTFPRHPLFLDPDGEGQALLANILTRIARFDATLQYCQGMNYVVGFLMMTALRCTECTVLDSSFVRNVCRFRSGGGEDMVFWQMVSLLDRPRYRMRGMWSAGFPDLNLRTHQFNAVFLETMPRLFAHFRSIDMMVGTFANQWYLTLFGYSLPLRLLSRAWDLFIASGWSALLAIGVALVKVYEARLLATDLEGVLKLFARENLHALLATPEACDTVLRCAATLHDRCAASMAHLEVEYRQERLRSHAPAAAPAVKRGERTFKTPHRGSVGSKALGTAGRARATVVGFARRLFNGDAVHGARSGSGDSSAGEGDTWRPRIEPLSAVDQQLAAAFAALDGCVCACVAPIAAAASTPSPPPPRHSCSRSHTCCRFSFASPRPPSCSALKYDVTVLQKKIETAAARAEAFGAELLAQQVTVASLRERAEQSETDTRELAEVIEMLGAKAPSNTDVARQLAPMQVKLDEAQAKRGALRTEWSLQSRHSAVRLCCSLAPASWLRSLLPRTALRGTVLLYQCPSKPPSLTLVRCASVPYFLLSFFSSCT